MLVSAKEMLEKAVAGKYAVGQFNINNLECSAGAGFVVVLTGDIMTMPGLPRVPAAEKIDVTADGKIVGLF